MAFPRNFQISTQRGIDVAVSLVEQQEEHLRNILESTQATPDEKFQALVALAHLAGISLHNTTVSDEVPNS